MGRSAAGCAMDKTKPTYKETAPLHAPGTTDGTLQRLERHTIEVEKRLASVIAKHEDAQKALVRAQREIVRLKEDIGLAYSRGKMEGIRLGKRG